MQGQRWRWFWFWPRCVLIDLQETSTWMWFSSWKTLSSSLWLTQRNVRKQVEGLDYRSLQVGCHLLSVSLIRLVIGFGFEGVSCDKMTDWFVPINFRAWMCKNGTTLWCRLALERQWVGERVFWEWINERRMLKRETFARRLGCSGFGFTKHVSFVQLRKEKASGHGSHVSDRCLIPIFAWNGRMFGADGNSRWITNEWEEIFLIHPDEFWGYPTGGFFGLRHGVSEQHLWTVLLRISRCLVRWYQLLRCLQSWQLWLSFAQWLYLFAKRYGS